MLDSSYKRLWVELAHEIYLADPSIEHKMSKRRSEKGAQADLPISILTAHYFRHNYAAMLHATGYSVICGIITAKINLEVVIVWDSTHQH